MIAAMGIGALAPGPGCGIAVWTLPNFASLQVRAIILKLSAQRLWPQLQSLFAPAPWVSLRALTFLVYYDGGARRG